MISCCIANARTLPNTRFWLFCYGEHFAAFQVLRTKTLMVFGAVLLGCALFAASDEFHQTFVKSRTPSVRDVLLDVTGALLGLLIGASFARRHPKKIRATTHNQFVDAQL